MNRCKTKPPEGSKLLKPGYLSGKSQRNFTAKKAELPTKGSSNCKPKKVYSRKVATPIKKDRPALQTITNNSPIVKVKSVSPIAISQTKVSGDDFNFKVPKVKPTQDFEFKSDPSSLASILNGDGVTRKDLITPRISSIMLSDGRVSDMLLLPDGRPSGCRRTLKVSTPTKFNKGPGRVLRSTKQAANKSKQNHPRSTSLYSRSTSSTVDRRNTNNFSSKQNFNSFTNSKPLKWKGNLGKQNSYKSLKQTNERKPTSFIQKKVKSNKSSVVELKLSKISRVKFAAKDEEEIIMDSSYSTENKPLPAASQKPPRSILKSKKVDKRSSPANINKKVSRKLKLHPSPPVEKSEKTTKDGNIEVLTPPVLNQIEAESLPAKNPSINRVLNHLQLQMKSTKRRSLQQEYKHAISVLSKNLQPIAEEDVDSRAEKQLECQKAPAAVVTPVKNKIKAASVNAKNEDKLKAKIEVLQREIKNIQLCQSQRKLQRSLVKQPLLQKSENSQLTISNPALAHRLMFNPGSYSPLPSGKPIVKDSGASPVLSVQKNDGEEYVKKCDTIPLNLDISTTSQDEGSIKSLEENKCEIPIKPEKETEMKTWKDELSCFNKKSQQSKALPIEKMDGFFERLNSDNIFKSCKTELPQQINEQKLANSFKKHIATTSSIINDTMPVFNQSLKKRTECFKPRFEPYSRKSALETLADEEVASLNLNSHKRKLIYKSQVPTDPVAKYLTNQQLHDFTSPLKFLP